MSWIASFFIAFLSGALGLLLAGLIASACIDWYHIPTREGGAGYFMVFMALLGGAIAFALGFILSRVAAGMADPGFFKGLGISLGAVLLIAGVVLLVAWWRADIAPKINGQSLELAIEVRAPKDFTLPKTLDEYGAYACVYLPRGRRQPQAKLQLDQARQLEGRWIVTAVVPLATSSSKKLMEVRFNKENNYTFWCPLRRHPRQSDLEWSKWFDSSWNAGTPEPPPEKKFNLRYRVQLVPPLPPGPTAEESEAKEIAEDQAKFDALKPTAPLEEWLAFLKTDSAEPRRQAVMKVLEARQPELAKSIGSTNEEVRETALLAVEYLDDVKPEINEAVLAEGRAIAAGIRRFNGMKEEETDFYDVQIQLRSRFNHWKQAWWTLHQHLGVDGRPPVQEIFDVATIRARGTSMDEIEVNARVILDALKPTHERP